MMSCLTSKAPGSDESSSYCQSVTDFTIKQYDALIRPSYDCIECMHDYGVRCTVIGIPWIVKSAILSLICSGR